MRVGPAGGTVTAPGVQLIIPAGALAQATDISIAMAAATPPAGVVALSQVLRFTPEGLTFSLPATVKMVAAGDATQAKIYWSKAGGATGFDALASELQPVSGFSFVSAQVSHFSIGFVGLPPPPLGACAAAEEALTALDKSYPPLGAATVSGQFVGLGPAGEVFLGGALHSYVSTDGKILKVLPLSAAAMDMANGWIYGTQTTAAGQVVQRHGATGCIENVRTFAGALSATVLGIGPTGNLLIAVRAPAQPETDLWLARDKGATWTKVGTFAEASYASEVVFAPSDANRIYVGLGGGSSTTPVGMATSRDGGATWKAMQLPHTSNGVFIGSVTSIAVHPTNPDLVYAATSGPTYKSTNGGTKWEPDFTLATRAYKLRYSSDGRLWALGTAASYNVSQRYLGVGLHVLDAAGTTWTAANGDLPAAENIGLGSFGLRERAGQPPELVRLGRILWRSTDGGLRWIPGPIMGAASQRSTALLTHPSNSQVIYSYTGAGASLWRSADGGQTWSPALVDKSFANAAVLGSSTLIAISINGEGFGLRSTDGGVTATPMTYTGTFTSNSERLAPIGDVSGVLQLQVDAHPTTAYLHLAPDLWRTQDDGVSWSKATSPDIETTDPYIMKVADVLADPKTPRRLAALRRSATSTTGESELALSTDAGTTWSTLALPPGRLVSGRRLWTFDADGNIWLVLSDTSMQPKLYKLAAGASTWTPAAAPPAFGSSLRALGNRLVLDSFISDGGAAWRTASLVSHPYLADLRSFTPRAAPTQVVFEYAGLRAGALP